MKIKLAIPIVLRRVRIIGLLGSREIDMILDTGAINTVISWDVAKDIGYDPVASETRAPIITANGIIEAPLITVDGIEIEELKAVKVEVICHDIPELVGIEGLLGLSFLKFFRTVVDFTTGILEITK